MGATLTRQHITPRNNDLYDMFPLQDLDLSRKICPRILYDLPHVAGRDLYDLHDLYSTGFPGWICNRQDPAQPLTTAGEELDELDHDLSDLSEVWKHIKSPQQDLFRRGENRTKNFHQDTVKHTMQIPHGLSQRQVRNYCCRLCRS